MKKEFKLNDFVCFKSTTDDSYIYGHITKLPVSEVGMEAFLYNVTYSYEIDANKNFSKNPLRSNDWMVWRNDLIKLPNIEEAYDI